MHDLSYNSQTHADTKLNSGCLGVGRQGWGILVYSRDQLRSTGWGEGGHRKGTGDREATDVGVGLSEGLNPQVRWKG